MTIGITALHALGAVPATVGLLALVLLGAVLGFAMFNKHPAKVFLGDAGSLPIGFCLAFMLIFVAKAIERVGDHAKNLAEQIIYIVKGTDVRHNPVGMVENLVR